MRLLLVEDNPDLSANCADYLETLGHTVDCAFDGIGGMHLALTHEYDAIVLDIMLPGMNGVTFCKRLREDAAQTVPIVMLTACDALEDKLSGFDAGADDYLTKPFSLQELHARLLAVVRRAAPNAGTRLKVGRLEFNLGTHQATREGRSLTLTHTGATILTELMKAHPNVVTRAHLEHLLWGDFPPGSDALRSHLYALRQALDKPFAEPMLLTVHGIGFRLVTPDEAQI